MRPLQGARASLFPGLDSRLQLLCAMVLGVWGGGTDDTPIFPFQEPLEKVLSAAGSTAGEALTELVSDMLAVITAEAASTSKSIAATVLCRLIPRMPPEMAASLAAQLLDVISLEGRASTDRKWEREAQHPKRTSWDRRSPGGLPSQAASPPQPAAAAGAGASGAAGAVNSDGAEAATDVLAELGRKEAVR